MAEEKKENGFTKLWSKAKKSISDTILENNLETQFNHSHPEFTVYIPTNALLSSFTVHGSVEDGKLVYYGEKEIKPFCVAINEVTKQAYYTGGTEGSVTVKVDYEGQTYERPGTSIWVDPDVTEVRVIKAGDRYFLYKGGKNDN